MIGFQALAWREWQVHRDLLLDYLAAALFSVTVLPGDSPIGFLLFGALFACSLGARIGGDENLHDTWEFVLTRPVGRDEWLRARFWMGAAALLLTLVLFAAADLVGLHAIVGRLLTEPGDVPPGAPFLVGAWLWTAGVVALIYTLGFVIALRERRPDQVLNHRGSGFVIGAVVSFVLMVISTFAIQGPAQFLGDHGIDSLPVGPEPYLFVLLVAVVARLVYVWGRRDLRRRDVAASGYAPAATVDASVAGWVALGVLIVVAALMLMWVLVRVPAGG